MRLRLGVLLLVALLLTACAGSVDVSQGEGFAARTLPQTLYVVPFDTVMVPKQVAEGLFDRFVDRLNAKGEQYGFDFIILKQGLAAIDQNWLAERDYLTGELFAYLEDAGSSTTAIRAKSRLRLYQPGQAEPTLELSYPTESFFEKDYSSIEQERRKLAEKISVGMADRLLTALAGKAQ